MKTEVRNSKDNLAAETDKELSHVIQHRTLNLTVLASKKQAATIEAIVAHEQKEKEPSDFWLVLMFFVVALVSMCAPIGLIQLFGGQEALDAVGEWVRSFPMWVRFLLLGADIAVGFVLVVVTYAAISGVMHLGSTIITIVCDWLYETVFGAFKSAADWLERVWQGRKPSS